MQQNAIDTQNTLVRDLMERVRSSEKELLDLRANKRKSEEEEEPITPPNIVKVTADDDDAWRIINKSARSLRPFCGDWEKRYRYLGRKAHPSKERLD